MRIVRFCDAQGQIHFGRDNGNDTAEILEGTLFDQARPLTSTGRIATIQRLLAPVQAVNIFCIGLNYRKHALESGAPVPQFPVVFMKPTTSQSNPGDPIRIPRCCHNGPEVDYECELGVVIGKPARDVPESKALDYVFGYTAVNDVSARHWQKQGGGGQWVRGKSFDTFCPMGPALVAAGNGPDEIADPQKLRLKTILNGQLMQDHTTGDMIFTVAQLIAFLSQDTTLLPGTVILTGTPHGVGMARKPPVYLESGDEVVIEVEKIGRLVNPVA